MKKVLIAGANGFLARNITGYFTEPVSYTHLRAHETRHDLVCRLLLEQEAASKIEAQLKGHFSRLGDTGQESPPVPSDSDSSMKGFVYRGVHLDYCIENHAIWFDRGEYTKIFAANSTGKKSLSKEEGQSAWDSLDIVSIPLDIIEISGDVFEGLGGFIADAVSSVDIF